MKSIILSLLFGLNIGSQLYAADDQQKLCNAVVDDSINYELVNKSKLKSFNFDCYYAKHGKNTSFLQILIWGNSSDKNLIQKKLLNENLVRYRSEDLYPILIEGPLELLKIYINAGANPKLHSQDLTMISWALNGPDFDWEIVKYLITEAHSDLFRTTNSNSDSAFGNILDRISAHEKAVGQYEGLFFYVTSLSSFRENANSKLNDRGETALNYLIKQYTYSGDVSDQWRIYGYIKRLLDNGAKPSTSGEGNIDAYALIDSYLPEGNILFPNTKRDRLLDLIKRY